MNPQLASLAERLVGNSRSTRDEKFRATLYNRQSDAAARGRLGTGFYAHEQQEACLTELKSRVWEIWNAYERVVSESGAPWSDEIAQDIVRRIEDQLTGDARELEEMARAVIVPHGHGFDLFLTKAVPSIVVQLQAEVELFGLRHRPASTSLAALLQAPRYAGVRSHWMKAESFIRASPPDLPNATKEAVSSLEAATKAITGIRDGTLGDCIKALRASRQIDPAILKTVEGLWGFANTSPGVRHGSPDAVRVTESESRFALDCCEAAIKYLLSIDA